MGFSNEAKAWAQKIQDAAKAALEKARGNRRQEAPAEVPTEAPAEAPEVAEVPAEAEASTEDPGEIPAEEVLEAAAAEADAEVAEEVPAEVSIEAPDVHAKAAARPGATLGESKGRKGDAVSHVTEHLQRRGVPFEVIPHGQAFTSLGEAQALGIAAGEVVKTVVVHAVSGPVLVAVPGDHRLDMPLVRTAVGDHHARLATEEELARDFPDFELGALPPLGSLLRAKVYVDPEVMDHDTVVFAAGSQTESVKIRTEDLFRDEPVTVAPLSRHAEEDDKELIE